jgi:uncharacterized iron-regulated protein
MKTTLVVCARAFVLFASLTSCLSTTATPHLASPLPMQDRVAELVIFSGATGKVALWEEVVQATLDADIVLLAELHGHPVGLPYHAEIFSDSLRADPSAALCLEFITRDWQYLLDAWAEGIVEWEAVEETFLTAPSTTATPHRPLIEMAHELGVPVYAANSPRIYTRAAKALGYEALAALSEEQQRLFQIPSVLPSGPYREGFYTMMSGLDEGHGVADLTTGDAPGPEEPFVPSESVKAKFRSQGLWDGTMADTVLKALDAGANRAFLVVGSYHANNDGGIVQVLRERRPSAKVVVVTFVAEDTPDLSDAEVVERYGAMADFVTFAGPYPQDDPN